jgi:hypothetical protein
MGKSISEESVLTLAQGRGPGVWTFEGDRLFGEKKSRGRAGLTARRIVM